MLKATVFTGLIFASLLSWSQQNPEIVVTTKLSSLKKVTESAIKAEYAKADGLNMALTDKDITDIEIYSVSEGQIEMTAIAPTPDKEEGIPYYCEVSLKKDSSDKYKATAVNCGKYD